MGPNKDPTLPDSATHESDSEKKTDILETEINQVLVGRQIVTGSAAFDDAVDLEGKAEAEQRDEVSATYMHGWSLWLLTVAIWMIIYVTNMEASIVSTGLVAISNQLNGFDDSTWIVSGYQISYTGFLVIWAKMSDIFGRKPSLMASVFIFACFSAACGAAQSMTQLIIFRVLQGSGASGAFAVTMAIVYEMVPKSKLPLYTGICFIVVALATTSGPLIGGSIITKSSWRWIFLLNVPAAALVLLILVVFMPADFGNHKSGSTPVHKETIWRLLRRVDILGAVLLLGASFLLVTALLEASTSFSWHSAVFIVLIILSAFLWASFVFWERSLRTGNSKLEEMFPWRFVQNRAWMAMLFISFLVGIPTSVILISIPQRFQIVNGETPLKAGIRLLPYTIASPFGLLIGNAVGGATKIPPVYLIFASSILQLLGLGLLDLIPVDGGMLAGMYVFEILIALGAGVTNSLTMLATPHCIDAKDIAVATSSMVQARMMGSAIGLAIATSVLNSYLNASLSLILSSSQISSLQQNLDTLNTLPTNVQVHVRDIFGKAFRLENWIIIAVSGMQVLAVGLIWKKKQISLHTHTA